VQNRILRFFFTSSINMMTIAVSCVCIHYIAKLQVRRAPPSRHSRRLCAYLSVGGRNTAHYCSMNRWFGPAAGLGQAELHVVVGWVSLTSASCAVSTLSSSHALRILFIAYYAWPSFTRFFHLHGIVNQLPRLSWLRGVLRCGESAERRSASCRSLHRT
jgi:hypothetical protein